MSININEALQAITLWSRYVSHYKNRAKVLTTESQASKFKVILKLYVMHPSTNPNRKYRSSHLKGASIINQKKQTISRPLSQLQMTCQVLQRRNMTSSTR